MNPNGYMNMVDSMIVHTPLYIYRNTDGIEIWRRGGISKRRTNRGEYVPDSWMGTFRTWREAWIYLDGFISGGHQ